MGDLLSKVFGLVIKHKVFIILNTRIHRPFFVALCGFEIVPAVALVQVKNIVIYRI